MTNPTTPFYLSAWGQEQSLIEAKLEDLHAIPPPSKVANKFYDDLGDIISHVGCSSYSIRFNHPHVDQAFEYIKGYPFPTTLEHYCVVFQFREWDIVCKTMLVAVWLGELKPNAFQRFMLGLYIYEHAPVCCCKCGLTPGIWCGE